MNSLTEATKVISEKIARDISPHLAKRKTPVKLNRPIVSITFDDCPASVVSNALPLLEKEGMLATLYVSCGLCDTENHFGRHMALSDIKPIFESGHEIGDHTFSHISANHTPMDAYVDDIEKNQDTLSNLDVSPSQSFAYPFGEINPFIKKRLESKFSGLRGIRRKSHNKYVDLNQIGSGRIYRGPSIESTLQQIQALEENPGWITLFSHDVCEKPTQYGCTQDNLNAVIQAVKDINAEVLTVASAIKKIGEPHGSSIH